MSSEDTVPFILDWKEETLLAIHLDQECSPKPLPNLSSTDDLFPEEVCTSVVFHCRPLSHYSVLQYIYLFSSLACSVSSNTFNTVLHFLHTLQEEESENTVTVAAAHKNVDYIVCATSSCDVVTVDLSSLKTLSRTNVPSKSGITDITFGPDARYFVVNLTFSFKIVPLHGSVVEQDLSDYVNRSRWVKCVPSAKGNCVVSSMNLFFSPSPSSSFFFLVFCFAFLFPFAFIVLLHLCCL